MSGEEGGSWPVFEELGRGQPSASRWSLNFIVLHEVFRRVSNEFFEARILRPIGYDG